MGERDEDESNESSENESDLSNMNTTVEARNGEMDGESPKEPPSSKENVVKMNVEAVLDASPDPEAAKSSA